MKKFCWFLGLSAFSGLVTELHAADPIPTYERLSRHWQPQSWSGYPFVFETYGGKWSPREILEVEKQKLLTPVWKDDKYRHTCADTAHLHEYLWAYRPNGASKRQCYELMRQHYQDSRKDRVLAKAKSSGMDEKNVLFAWMDGHGWYEPYIAEWGGCDLLGIEVGATTIASQVHLALLRAACRFHKLPSYVQVSQWFEPAFPFFLEGENEFSVPNAQFVGKMEDASGGRSAPLAHCNAGHSPSFLSRQWYVAWLSGSSLVVPEAAQANFFAWKNKGAACKDYPDSVRIPLSPIGKRAQKFVEVTTSHPDRGIQYTPFGVILDHFAGFNGYHYIAPRPFNVLDPTPGDIYIHVFFDTVFPGSMRRDMVPGLGDTSPWFNAWSEDRCLVRSPYGDSFDVFLSPPPGVETDAAKKYPLNPNLGNMYYDTSIYQDKLNMYPVVIVLGDHEFLMETTMVLGRYLKQGGRVFITQEHADRLGPKCDTLRKVGRLELYDPRNIAGLMAKLSEEYLPIKVEGNLEYIINRTARGWVVGLINNEGVSKRPSKAVEVDPSKTQQAVVALKSGALSAANEWCTESKLDIANGNAVMLEVPPGEVRIVELIDK